MPRTEVAPGVAPTPSTTLVCDARAADGVRDYRSFLEAFVDPTAFRRIVAICLDCTGEELFAQWEPLVGDGVDDVGIIDVGTQDRSSSTATDRPDASFAVVEEVSDPADPEAVLGALGGYCTPFDDASGPALFLVDSLDPYVSRLSSDAVRSFVDALTYHVRGFGGQGWVWIDAATDDWGRHGVAASFDTVLHRTEDGVTDLESPDPDGTFSPDDAFDLLTPPRRRYLLHALALARKPSLSLYDLVAWIVRWDAGATSERLTRLHLLHTDLPKLDRAGVIRFDPSVDRVEPLEPLAALQPELRRTARHDFGTDPS